MGNMRKPTILLVSAIVLLILGNNGIMAQWPPSWEEIGPSNTGNHVRAMVVDNNHKVWAGSLGGGLWTSTNNGSSWDQVASFSEKENLNVSCIAIDGNKIYVGTGSTYFYRPEQTWGGNWAADSIRKVQNGYLRMTDQPGEGVLVSTDGGATWDHDNGTWNSGSVPLTGDFVSIQAVASENGITLIASLSGLYRSTDADLANVAKCQGTNRFMTGVITDIDFGNNGVVYACTRDSVYRSTDGGLTFGKGINDLFPKGTQAPNNRIAGHRGQIAVAPSNRDVMYFTGVNDINGNCTGVWKSTDNGYTWASISPFESAVFNPFQNKGLYGMFLGVAPRNPDHVFIGGAKSFYFTPAEGWKTAASHANIPGFNTRYMPTPSLCIAFDPNSDSTFFVGTDDEIVRTFNLGRTYSSASRGFNNAHLYGISPSPTFQVLVSDRFHGVSLSTNGRSDPNQRQFNNIYTADSSGGGIARWSVTHPQFMVVAVGRDRGLKRSVTDGVSYEEFYGPPTDSLSPCSDPADTLNMYIHRKGPNSKPEGIRDRSTAPIMPFCFDEYIEPASLSDDTLILKTPSYLFLAGGNFIWVCQNPFGGIDSLPTWNRVSRDFIQQDLPYGRKKYFTAIAATGDADHYVFVGTNNGEIVRLRGAHDPQQFCDSVDAVRISTGQGLPNRWISDIEVDPTNTSNLLVTFAGFPAGDDRVYICNNAKDSAPIFRSLQGNLPPDLPVHSAAFHPDPTQKSILIGTEKGIYGTTDDYESAGGVSWSFVGSDIGIVPVTDIAYRRWYMEFSDPANYHYAPDNTVFVATNGRGAFKSTSLVSRPEGVVSSSGIRLKAVPNPTVKSTALTFDLPQATHVKLSAFGIDGRPVAELTDSQFGAGQSSVDFNTQDLPAGIYLIAAQFSNANGIFLSNLRVVVIK
jgi:hypothetical protein